ncbi:CubicO group peptidase (beta-lactamase class C family) [Microbacterium kyungheense]|uniref:CubicO group peptidase (Beta-lactamase class C family) n=1 Tax=Microbacterium kyungheense TaxID=1263636 RepID=A0A543F2G1_9MICO|nr:CubicO group peptidase (beta-lactamase class C family) [Microbacterium kyungheense]
MVTDLLPRSTPEQQSIPATAIESFVAALGRIAHVHTVTVVRHGHVVGQATWAPYERDDQTAMYSVSKSFTSMAAGIAIGEGRFGLDDRVIDLLPAVTPDAPSDHLTQLRVRHLLTMTTGHTSEAELWDGDWARDTLAAELVHAPGTHWMYNTPATHLLSLIVQTRTGERLLDYLRPRLFEPLGFVDPTWLQSPTGVDAGGFGLSIRPEELAAFGQLLLQRGTWKGRQLVPAEWIDEATRRQVANDPGESDWNQGYGFQFWRCHHGAYRGDGAFGQYVVVMPEQDVVVAITGGLPDMQLPLDAVWAELLPALDSVPAAPAGGGAVVVPTTGIPAPEGEVRAGEVLLEFDDAPLRRLRIASGVLDVDGYELRCLPGQWSVSTFPADPAVGRLWYGDRVAVVGGWNGALFTADLRLLQDARTLRIQVDRDGHMRITQDVGFEGTELWEGDARQPVVAHQSVVSP